MKKPARTKKPVSPSESLGSYPIPPDHRSGLSLEMALKFLSRTKQCLVGINSLGEVVWMNEKAERLTGISFFQAKFKKVDEVFQLKTETTGLPVRNPFNEVIDLKQTVRMTDLSLISKNGVEIPVRARWESVEGSIEEAEGENSIPQRAKASVLLFATDLTVQRRLEEKKREEEKKLRSTQRLEVIGSLAGGVAHDLNNLLSVILGNANLAILDLKRIEASSFGQGSLSSPLQETKKRVELVENTATVAQNLTRQILTFSKDQASPATLTQLASLVGEMGALLKASVSKKIDLDFVFGENPTLLKGHPDQLRQMVLNLVINAAEAIGDKKGGVRVETGVLHASASLLAKAVPENLSPGRYVFLRVSDTGSGIPKAVVSKIFDPFFTTKATGTGLGLAVVFGAAKAHQGGIIVESKEGEGTSFMVLLPTEAAYTLQFSELSSSEMKAPLKPARKGGTLLLVDDEGNILTLMKEVLENEGFKVFTAETALEGIELFKSKNGEIDAVLLDLGMPDMDGTEACDEMRKIRSDLPVLVSSGHAEDSIIARLTAHGIKYFLQKPFMPNQLVNKVYETLAQGSDVSGQAVLGS